MKQIILLTSIILFFSTHAVFAAETITPTPVVHYTNEFTVKNEPSDVIKLLKNFIEGFDSFLGGFIFYTPNPFGSTIQLKDKSEIPGVVKYRNMFYEISIPALAIILSSIAIRKIGSDSVEELKTFAVRFFMVIVLFITTPFVLSYSIQANNLLVDKISTTQQFTTFLSNYFDKSQQEIQNNNNSDQFGIPSFDISLKDGIFQSFGKFIVQVLLFAITFLFLLGGFIYIGFQFVIRFASLLFLAVIYPIVIPFYLAESTEGIVHTFFKSWLTFLIQQPAFVLGFAIATDIFNSVLQAKGPSIGMLFFYTGFLFFLAGVNVLVGRIFGNAWDAFATNMQAAIATRSVTSPIQSRINDFKQGLLGGSVSNTAGRSIRNIFSKKKYSAPDEEEDKKKKNKQEDDGQSFETKIRAESYKGDSKPILSSPSTVLPEYSTRMASQGMTIQMENQKQGTVSISGDSYAYTDPKTHLSTLYSSKLEALQDGIPEDSLRKIHLTDEKFIDLSSFNKHNHNPHNYNAMKQAQKKGKSLDYAHLNEKSPPDKINNFLEMSKARNDAFGIKGVIVKRQAKKGSDEIVKLYTKKL